MRMISLSLIFYVTLIGISSVLQGTHSFTPPNNNHQVGCWTTTTTTTTTTRQSSSSTTFISRTNPRKYNNRIQQQQQQRQHRQSAVQPLQAVSPLLSVVASPVGSLGVLILIVLIHECGHYFAARSFGIKVEEFSLGVGPKVFGFNAAGNDFNLRALPLGGYVRFPENYNITLARQIAIEDEKQFQDYIRSTNLGIGQQILNAITLGAVVDTMWNNEKKRRQEEYSNKKTPKKQNAWWNFGGKKDTSSSTPPPIGTGEIEYYNDPTLLQNRPWQERAIVLSGGVVFNFLTAFIIYFSQIGYGPGLPQPIFDQGIIVSANPKPDAAASGILRQGDVIIGINGQRIQLSQSPTALESSQAINNFITKIRQTPDGETLQIEILRNKNPVEVTIQPKRIGGTETSSSPQTIGVLLAPNYIKSELVKTDNPVVAAELAYKYVSALIGETANGLSQFLKSLIVGSADGSSDISTQVSGPIGLIRAGSEIVATKDFTNILLFAAAISVNLGVVNALPIPALDGGQLIFVLAEAITGRKIDQRIEEGVTSIAVLFLILLSISTVFGDVTNIIVGR